MKTTKIAEACDELKETEQIKEPGMYKVIAYNDDDTSQDFVVELLVRIFQKPPREAVELMWKIHTEGSAIIGVFTYDMASSLVRKAHQLARSADFPLRLEYEPA
ncbi:MAG: ATP-dependent Clp protease adaptor ClpS [Spirochaetia bacterium]